MMPQLVHKLGAARVIQLYFVTEHWSNWYAVLSRIVKGQDSHGSGVLFELNTLMWLGYKPNSRNIGGKIDAYAKCQKVLAIYSRQEIPHSVCLLRSATMQCSTDQLTNRKDPSRSIWNHRGNAKLAEIEQTNRAQICMQSRLEVVLFPVVGPQQVASHCTSLA